MVGFLGSFDVILNVPLFFPPDAGAAKTTVTAHGTPCRYRSAVICLTEIRRVITRNADRIYDEVSLTAVLDGDVHSLKRPRDSDSHN